MCSHQTLLMVSYPFPPNESAGAVRSERFARLLPSFGWNVEVVTPRLGDFPLCGANAEQPYIPEVRVNYTQTLDPWLYLRTTTPRLFVLRGIKSVLMHMFSFPDHMLLWIPFALAAGRRICREQPIDAIYTTSPPHSTHLAGCLLARHLKKPWVADFRDPWMQNAYRPRQSALISRVERSMEKAVVQQADVILVNTNTNRMKLLQAHPHLLREKVVHLPNGWDDDSCSNSAQEGGEGFFRILHAGTFYPAFEPYGLLHALAHWRKSNFRDGLPAWPETLRVQILGATDQSTMDVIMKLELADIVQVIPWLPLRKARQLMGAADLLWTSLGTHPRSSGYIPSKIFEYIAAHRPILGFFPEGEASSLIRETGTGTVFTSDDPLPVIRTLAKMIEQKQLASLPYTPNGQAVARYAMSGIVRKLANILNQLSVQGNTP